MKNTVFILYNVLNNFTYIITSHCLNYPTINIFYFIDEEIEAQSEYLLIVLLVELRQYDSTAYDFNQYTTPLKAERS